MAYGCLGSVGNGPVAQREHPQLPAGTSRASKTARGHLSSIQKAWEQLGSIGNGTVAPQERPKRPRVAWGASKMALEHLGSIGNGTVASWKLLKWSEGT